MAEIIDTQSTFTSDSLGPGQFLDSSHSGFSSPNSQYHVSFSTNGDGDLKIFSSSTNETIWSAMGDNSVPSIVGGSVLMQSDGNLVGLSSNPSHPNKPVWSTGTDTSYDEQENEVPNANPGAVLSLQDNGILVIRRENGKGRVVWASRLEDGMSPFAGPNQVKSGLWITSTLPVENEVEAQ